jgi:hypothetical protein
VVSLLDANPEKRLTAEQAMDRITTRSKGKIEKFEEIKQIDNFLAPISISNNSFKDQQEYIFQHMEAQQQRKSSQEEGLLLPMNSPVNGSTNSPTTLIQGNLNQSSGGNFNQPSSGGSGNYQQQSGGNLNLSGSGGSGNYQQQLGGGNLNPSGGNYQQSGGGNVNFIGNNYQGGNGNYIQPQPMYYPPQQQQVLYQKQQQQLQQQHPNPMLLGNMYQTNSQKQIKNPNQQPLNSGQQYPNQQQNFNPIQQQNYNPFNYNSKDSQNK